MIPERRGSDCGGGNHRGSLPPPPLAKVDNSTSKWIRLIKSGKINPNGGENGRSELVKTINDIERGKRMDKQVGRTKNTR